MIRSLSRGVRRAAAALALVAPVLAAQKDTAATPLPTVEVKARKPVVGTLREQFADRQALGLGTFFDSSAVRQMDGGRLSERLRGVPGLRFVEWHEPGEGNYSPQVRAASSVHTDNDGGICFSTVIYDGVTLYRAGRRGLPPDFRRDFEVTGLEAIEFYRGQAQAPLGLASEADCGILVLWSRRKH